MQFLIQPWNDGTDTEKSVAAWNNRRFFPLPSSGDRAKPNDLCARFSEVSLIARGYRFVTTVIVECNAREIMDHRTTDNKAGYANEIVNGASLN